MATVSAPRDTTAAPATTRPTTFGSLAELVEDDPLVEGDAVAELFGLSRSALKSQIARGSFPAPRKVGRRMIWRRSTIAALLP